MQTTMAAGGRPGREMPIWRWSRQDTRCQHPGPGGAGLNTPRGAVAMEVRSHGRGVELRPRRASRGLKWRQSHGDGEYRTNWLHCAVHRLHDVILGRENTCWSRLGARAGDLHPLQIHTECGLVSSSQVNLFSRRYKERATLALISASAIF